MNRFGRGGGLRVRRLYVPDGNEKTKNSKKEKEQQ